MILCAAHKITIKDTDKYVIMPCHRHGDYLKNFATLGLLGFMGKTHVQDGFICTDGRFVDRKSALQEAIDCGQLSQSTRWYKEDHDDDELYSEDLY